jgi:hypothetical protein
VSPGGERKNHTSGRSKAWAKAGISASAAYELVNTWLATDGQTGLPAVRLGRTIRIPRAAIDRLAAVGGAGDGTGGAA